MTEERFTEQQIKMLSENSDSGWDKRVSALASALLTAQERVQKWKTIALKYYVWYESSYPNADLKLTQEEFSLLSEEQAE